MALRRPAASLAAVAVIGLLVSACAGSGRAEGGSVTVVAAASLRGAFTEIADLLAAAEPGLDVELSFDSSATLATQIREGAPADVFASADETTMAALEGDGEIEGSAEAFAANRLVVVSQAGNPAGIGGLADLPGAGVVALCSEDAPCGRYAQAALDEAGVSLPASSVTRAPNATATLTAVAQGDAVAGIVYATDAAAAGESVDTIAIRGAADISPTYVIAAVRRSDEAAAFIDFVLSDAGQAVLEEHGFLPPP